MTDEVSVALLEYLRKVGLGLEPEFLREAIRVMSEALMELEAIHIQRDSLLGCSNRIPAV